MRIKGADYKHIKQIFTSLNQIYIIKNPPTIEFDDLYISFIFYADK